MEIDHEPDESRFVARLENGEAALVYDTGEAGVLALNHTFVPPEHRGRGVAGALVERAFAYAGENGLRIRPNCPYVRAWLQKHPEQGERVASEA